MQAAMVAVVEAMAGPEVKTVGLAGATARAEVIEGPAGGAMDRVVGRHPIRPAVMVDGGGWGRPPHGTGHQILREGNRRTGDSPRSHE